MQFNFVLLLALTRLVTAESGPKATDIDKIFSPVLSSQALIYLANDSSDNVVPRWSTYKNPSYVATIKPASEEDVQNIVSTAQQKKSLQMTPFTQTNHRSQLRPPMEFPFLLRVGAMVSRLDFPKYKMP
jgi:hypothetical protein